MTILYIYIYIYTLRPRTGGATAGSTGRTRPPIHDDH